jgi:hypothetical protein
MLAAGGERDIEGGGDGFRIGEEEFVEIAHAEEEQRIRVVGLEGEPLCHGRRCARRVGNLQGVLGAGELGASHAEDLHGGITGGRGGKGRRLDVADVQRNGRAI